MNASSTIENTNRRKFIFQTLATVVLAGLLVQHCRRNGARYADAYPEPALVHEFSVFATRATLQFWGESNDCRAAAAAIEARLMEMHDRINLFDSDSELAGLNATAYERPFTCGDELWRLVNAARDAYARTDGAFDISVGPLMRLWGFHTKQQTYPAEKDVGKALAAVGLNKIKFDDDLHTVQFTHPESYLDFGGVAKGYALDLAVEIARKHGLDTGIIDLGGNIYCLEKSPQNSENYAIGIRDPQWGDRLLKTLPLLDQAVATSGNYESFLVLDGKFVHHIIDPETGYPVSKIASVTVVAPKGVDTDILSTAIFVRGEKFAEEVTACDARIGVIIVRTDAEGRQRQREIETFGNL